MEFRLEFPGRGALSARLAAAHPEADIALLATERDLPVAPRALALTLPSPGTTTYVIGYRPGLPDPPAARTAILTRLGMSVPLYQPYGMRAYPTLMVDSTAGGGDSGGALLDQSGNLVGVVVGGSDDLTTGKRLTHVVPAALLAELLSP
jgi:S1-C subfamily serine protease